VSPKIGIVLPVRELQISDPNTAAGTLLEGARQVEDLGFDSVWVADSFVVRPQLEPLTLLAAISAVTRNVTIGTAALPASTREPRSLGHMMATIDQLSGGRLVMGLAMGEPLPNQVVTESYTERVNRIDEAVRAFKAVWQGRDDELKGTYYDLSELRQQGRPLTSGGPGIWLAGNGKPKAVARAGALYDGWLPVRIEPAQYRESLLQIQQAVRAADRDPGDFTPSLYVSVNVDRDAEAAEAALNEYTDRYYKLPLSTMQRFQNYFGGTEKELIAYLREYIDAGCRHITMRINSLTDYDRILHAIGENVVPAIHEITTD
jgi:alkanesulfonate monooxygenase SsuD/methylene tetrahydromethanopterin reductase-like flavin-dependent oxidoreductase (luciferase family)